MRPSSNVGDAGGCIWQGGRQIDRASNYSALLSPRERRFPQLVGSLLHRVATTRRSPISRATNPANRGTLTAAGTAPPMYVGGVLTARPGSNEFIMRAERPMCGVRIQSATLNGTGPNGSINRRRRLPLTSLGNMA